MRERKGERGEVEGRESGSPSGCAEGAVHSVSFDATAGQCGSREGRCAEDSPRAEWTRSVAAGGTSGRQMGERLCGRADGGGHSDGVWMVARRWDVSQRMRRATQRSVRHIRSDEVDTFDTLGIRRGRCRLWSHFVCHSGGTGAGSAGAFRHVAVGWTERTALTPPHPAHLPHPISSPPASRARQWPTLTAANSAWSTHHRPLNAWPGQPQAIVVTVATAKPTAVSTVHDLPSPA